MTKKVSTPRARVQKVPEKRIARTAGVKGTGKCGHEYATRISLWPVAGEPVTPATVDQRSKLIDEAAVLMSTTLCTDCAAQVTHEDAEEEEGILLAGFGLPALPELKGSIRQRAWARAERNSLLVGVVADQMWSVSMPHLSDAFFSEALTARFGAHSGVYEGAEFAELFTAMRQMFNSPVLPLFWGSREPAPTQQEMIATWLLVRDAVSQLSILREDEARRWILFSKSRRMRLRWAAHHASLNQLLAVKLVVSVPGWENPNQMFTAVQQLMSWANEADRGMVRGTPNATLPEVLEQIAVMRALSPNRDLDFPF